MTYHSAPLPWEVGVFDAQEAVRRGRTPPLEAYLRDAAKGAALIADAVDPGDGVPTLISSMSDRAKGGSKVQDKFDGTSGQIKQAIDRGSVPVIGCYLRELSELFNLMASALSNNDPRAEWKLSFARRWPGRPVDPKRLLCRTRHPNEALVGKEARDQTGKHRQGADGRVWPEPRRHHAHQSIAQSEVSQKS